MGPETRLSVAWLGGDQEERLHMAQNDNKTSASQLRETLSNRHYAWPQWVPCASLEWTIRVTETVGMAPPQGGFAW